MSTNYTVYEDDRKELALGEHSNLLDIDLYTKISRYDQELEASLNDLEPIQVIEIALQMIKVASYYTDGEYGDTKKRIIDRIDRETYFY